VWAYGRGQTDRHVDARDHYTFCVVYDSCNTVTIAIITLAYNKRVYGLIS